MLLDESDPNIPCRFCIEMRGGVRAYANKICRLVEKHYDWTRRRMKSSHQISLFEHQIVIPTGVGISHAGGWIFFVILDTWFVLTRLHSLVVRSDTEQLNLKDKYTLLFIGKGQETLPSPNAHIIQTCMDKDLAISSHSFVPLTVVVYRKNYWKVQLLKRALNSPVIFVLECGLKTC